MTQLPLSFEPGLSDRWESLLECIDERARSHAKPLKAVAADMNLSLSDLSRKLKPGDNDPRMFNVHDLEAYIATTGDCTPIFYLAEKYCADNEAKQRAATTELVRLLPKLTALVKAAGKL